MLSHIKYAARQSLGMRLCLLAITGAVNVLFIILAAAGALGLAGMVLGIVLSSLALCVLFVVAVVADVQVFRGFFAAPGAYMTLLVPAPGWKVLLGGLIPMTVFDVLSLTIGIGGITVQGMLLANAVVPGLDELWVNIPMGESVCIMVFYVIISYLLLMISIALVCALMKSVFFRSRFKVFLAAAGLLAVHYVLNLLDFSLLAVAPHVRVGLVFMVTVAEGLNAGSIGLAVLGLVKVLILFFVTARLLERRINL